MDTQHMTQPDSVRNHENQPSPGGDYVAIYVRDHFAIKTLETAKTIARLAGLGGEEGVRR
jgi:hypothetical protein